MSIAVHYPCHSGSGAPRALSVAAIRAVAAQVRQQIAREPDSLAVTVAALLQAGQGVAVNGRTIGVVWDLAHSLRDEGGRRVLGICDTDPEEPDCAFVSVNAELTEHRPDLALSTAAHEFGHVLFDVPAALQTGMRRFRAVAADAAALDRVGRSAEGRANEFMGALLAPPVALHTRLLAHARSEGLRFARGPHQGRPGSPILAAGNPVDGLAGVLAALAGDFGVSERFIAVRLARYGLLEGSVP
ncbi:ImmA/IrrE family metallo-endopeptidase [Neoroseomonas lacus]|uniref:IrrE N-terminal-like domain-containing protein n=1 Tax=Neoroseomonas lacus TaxID=287609 RepID=A0A917KBJ5_9PROT|nr:ImmA/IrrE family metallo-endopeptidase [Neoroseomonas lacus]GGJ07303.1 hypothetical protein GCM10011320_12770 [Neoroseomonas lacus]